RRFCEAAERSDLADDPRFQTNAGRVTHRDELLPELERLMRTRTTAEWLERLDRAGVPAGPILSVADLVHDPHVRHRQMIVDLEHPRAGVIRVTGIPVKLSETPGAIYAPPPLLGQHTDEVLEEFGIDAEE